MNQANQRQADTNVQPQRLNERERKPTLCDSPILWETKESLDKHPLPSNSSLTIQFVREEKLTVATTPTQLTQGIAPSAVGLTFNQFTATMEQYGTLVILSDLAELTARHAIVERIFDALVKSSYIGKPLN
jgi:N4-gp56 family major capsid protein